MTVYTLIPLVSCIVFLVLLGVTLRYARRNIAHIFGLYISAAMLWSLFSFQARWNQFPEHLLLWHKLIIISLMLVPVTYYHFSSAFTNRVSKSKLAAGYGFVLLLTILTVANSIADPDISAANGLLEYDLDGAEYFLALFGSCYMALAIVSFIQFYRSSTNPQDRNKASYLLAGAAVLLVLAVISLTPPFLKYPIDQIGNLTNALVITYVVARYQLLDIKLVIRTGLTYSGLTIVLTSMYLLILVFIYELFQAWTGGTLLLAAGLTLLFALTFQPLRTVIQRWVDRLFYRDAYNYRQILLTFSQRMSNVLNLNELAEEMLFPLTKALHTRKAYLLLPDPENGDFITRFVQPPSTEGAEPLITLVTSNPIVIRLSTEGTTLNREQISTMPESIYLSELDQAELKKLEIALFCPIIRKGELIGILALSEKHSGVPYSNEDIDLLTTITREAAMIIENAIILDNLKEHQFRTEQLLTKTVIAREEERKRVSTELHDSIAQWLVGASYHTQTCTGLISGENHRELKEELTEIEDTIDKCIKEIRRIMSNLHPPSLEELGLVPALRRIVSEMEKYKIVYQFNVINEPVRLPTTTELVIYRVVQESLNNIRKHSEAGSVILDLQFSPDSAYIEIKDDGKGFDLAGTMRNKVQTEHMGLRIMKESAAMLGGNLTINTGSGKGTSIALTLPISSTVNEEHN